MAKTFYVPVNGQSVKPTKVYAPVNGYSKKIVKAYASVNGYSKLFFEGDVAPPGAIYWHGDLRTSLTGGWETTAKPSWSGSTCVAPTVTYNSKTVTVSQDSIGTWTNKVGQFKTVNKIDLTNYTKLKIKSSGYVNKGGTSTGMHAIIEFVLHDNMNDYIDPNYVDEYARPYAVENQQTNNKSWTDEIYTINLNQRVLSKGLEYFILNLEMNTGRGTITISEIWFE